MKPMNYQQQYLKTKVETASPGELTLLLYEELFRKLSMAKKSFHMNQFDEMMPKVHGAREILFELISTLNMQYDISKQLYALYEYYLYCINQFIISKDEKFLEEVIQFAKDYAETWKQALLISKKGNS
ncbi:MULTISPECIES: flagellar export chaperone FliS [Paenibacillus]|uniref:Flagellar protein FliS n=1 Tax=Paenibacillus alvei TaxID=44250 RepID=A0A383RJG0_PAEAL|nr:MULTISPECIES: flagellar export chaperone FliS [Paenibacillus]GAV12417.1 flagellar protein FliS [Paenibacillus sp. NAIST15-1]SYX86499.1 Flagellar protein FliS [Paenibacillus alvei]